ncbi:MAG TPA: hypothetical protein EYP28_05790, partial [Methanophagales archaeon]|nr:hypothetical protein [Methanophagales archaeon]
MKQLMGLILIVTALKLWAADVPIIFLHGHKSEADTVAGFKTWNPPDYTTAMQKILNVQYNDYTAGKPLNCHMDSELVSTSGKTKKIYNFSYYHPKGARGVISLTAESVLVYLRTGYT